MYSGNLESLESLEHGVPWDWSSFGEYLDRLDGNPDAADKLVAATRQRIEQSGLTRWGDIENMLMAGEVETARSMLPQTTGYGWSTPPRMMLHINDKIDSRYLPYRPNMLLLVDEFPGIPEAFLDIGVDIIARGKERGFID